MSVIVRKMLQIVRSLPRFRGRTWLQKHLLNFTDFAPSHYGPLMYVDIADYTNKACLLGYYGDELAKMIRAMPRNGCFLDFGANAGLYSLIADEHLQEGRVLSFEPARPNYLKLLRNLELNRASRVMPFNFGLAESTRMVSFAFSREHSGGAHVTEPSEASDHILVLDGSELAGFLKSEMSTPCLCKIDTEGSELTILNVLAETGLIEQIDCFHIEIDEINLQRLSASVAEVYELLEGQGFAPKTDRRGMAHYDEIFRRS